MLKHKLYFVVNFLICLSPNFTNDFYSKFHQKDYKIDFQRIELINYDKSVYNFYEIKTFKYNRSTPIVNMTFNLKVNMSTDVEVAVQFYKFLSNEYRSLPGINFQVNFCKSIAANIVGLQILHKCGNFTTCRMVKETTYTICNIYFDETRFPSFLPNGEYKFQMRNIYNGKTIATLALFAKVYRPVAVPRKHKSVS